MATSTALADDLALYLRRIGEFPLLDAQQERYLAWRIINDDDDDARQLMIQSNLRLVVSECRAHVGRGLPFMDLIAEGNIGLIRAVNRFDPAIGVRFSTYAVSWIRRMLQLALLNSRSLIRIPPRQIITTASDDNGSVPEIVVVRAAGHILDPYRTIPCNGDQPDQTADIADAVRRMLIALDTVDHRQAQILRMRLGLLGHDPMSYRTIGRLLGISHERARQIGHRGLERLRNELR